MKILYVADGRSPIALNWIRYFVTNGHQVHLATTFQVPTDAGYASLEFIPVAFSAHRPSDVPAGGSRREPNILWSGSNLRLRTILRSWLGHLTIPQAAKKLFHLIDQIQPDVVHAMRIPYEGMLAAAALANRPKPPLIISVWGNDFTLHARSNPWMGRYTRLALQRADGLHTDCHRDRNLAYRWGYLQAKPAVVLPGNGGVQQDIFFPPADPPADRAQTLIQPRGFRAYVRNDTFFKALPLLLQKHPDLKILCPGMAGEPQAVSWVTRLGLGNAVDLLPKVDRATMADLFRRSAIAVSPTTHDGTPNTLLEAMSCGCFPVAGDLESIREWIDPGSNGLLFDPSSPEALAEAVLAGLAQSELRAQAASINHQLVRQRAAYASVMDAALRFYQDICR